jgi:hypothetical protein
MVSKPAVASSATSALEPTSQQLRRLRAWNLARTVLSFRQKVQLCTDAVCVYEELTNKQLR